MRNILPDGINYNPDRLLCCNRVAQASAVPASSATPEAQPGLIVIQEDVLIPLNRRARASFPHGEHVLARVTVLKRPRTSGRAAALVKLEAARHDSTNRTGLEGAAKQLGRSRLGSGYPGASKSPKELNDTFARLTSLSASFHPDAGGVGGTERA